MTIWVETEIETIRKNVLEFERKKSILKDQISISEFQKLLYMIEGIIQKISIASGYAHLRYAADTSSNDAASLVTRIDMLEAELRNRLLFFDLWFKKKINPNDALRLIDSVSIQYKEYLKHCYAYSFGNLLVISLYQQFRAEGKSFIPSYFKILEAGGSRKTQELLKDSGIDISDERFWQQGFDLVENKINEFKNLDAISTCKKESIKGTPDNTDGFQFITNSAYHFNSQVTGRNKSV